MNMTKSAFLLDVDKTLTNYNREISPKTKEVLNKLFAQNTIVSICTGRTYSTLLHYVLPLFPKDALHIIAGGGQIIKSNGEVVWEQNIPNERAKEICLTVKKLGGGYIFGKRDDLYIDEDLIKKFKSSQWVHEAKTPDNLADWTTPLLNIRLLNPLVEEYIYDQADLTIKKLTSYDGTDYFDLTAKDVHKANAAKIWAEKMNVNLKNVIAVGDSANDLEILEAAGHGVAMGNATDDLKAVANEVIGKADEDGLAFYLEQFI